VRTLKSILAATAVIALAAGCSSSPPQQSQAKYQEGGTFTIAVAGDPGALNPLNNSSTTSNWLFRFLYDQIVTRGNDGEILSGLATKWEFDGSTAVFTINDKATCYDGSAITPSVIGKNFEYILNAENPSTVIGSVIPNRNFTYEADDATHTLTLKLQKPFSLLLSSLSFMNVVCGPGLDDPASITTTSSGSGPFVLKAAVPNSQYVLTKRDGYAWGTDGATNDTKGFPDEVVFKIVDNETTSANLLLSGEVNAAVVNGQDRARLKAAGTTEKAYTSGGVVMSFNQTAGKITADKQVRLALTKAIDRGAVATTVTQGLLPKAGTSVSAASPQVCDDSAAAKSIPKFDTEGAKRMLDDAGWKPGGDGVRMKDGVRLSFTASHSTATPGAAAAVELMADAWSKVGAEAIITPLAQADYSQKVFSTGDYDVMAIQQFSNPFPSTLTGLIGGPFPPNGTNAGHIDNPVYKQKIQEAMASGENSGCKFWTEASAALFESADMIPLAAWPTNWVLKGAEMHTLGGRPIATSIRVLAQ
jgi:peptide/nickel transport system substrate-binding protein